MTIVFFFCDARACSQTVVQTIRDQKEKIAALEKKLSLLSKSEVRVGHERMSSFLERAFQPNWIAGWQTSDSMLHARSCSI